MTWLQIAAIAACIAAFAGLAWFVRWSNRETARRYQEALDRLPKFDVEIRPKVVRRTVRVEFVGRQVPSDAAWPWPQCNCQKAKERNG